jgi:hypothetical protein
VPVRVNCPHCRTPCLVAEEHLGVPVQCGRCARTFTTAPAVAAAPRIALDVGAATAPGRVRDRNEACFLVQKLSWCNLDDRHELAVLAIANGPAISKIGAALMPLLNNVLNGTAKDIAASGKDIGSTATVIVVQDGEVSQVNAGDGRIYHQRAGRLTPVMRPLKLAAGDWLLVSQEDLEAFVLQTEIGKSTCSAVEVAQQLAERSPHHSGSDRRTVIAVRCY